MEKIKLTIEGKPVPNNTKFWVNPAIGTIRIIKDSRDASAQKKPQIKRF